MKILFTAAFVLLDLLAVMLFTEVPTFGQGVGGPYKDIDIFTPGQRRMVAEVRKTTLVKKTDDGWSVDGRMYSKDLSQEAIDKIREYHMGIKIRRNIAEMDIAEGRAKLVLELKKLQTIATKKGDLDAAIALRDTAKELGVPTKHTTINRADHLPKPRLKTPRLAAKHAGHSYLVVRSHNINWFTAKDRCEKMGGRLVIVNTEAERQFLRTIVGDNNYYIGATMTPQKGMRWIDGSPIPSALIHRRRFVAKKGWDFVYFNGGGTVWNHQVVCPTIPGYVCEWDY